ncbi:DUF3348 domain-containing protein [Paraburkholderia acidipaludis]|uniref:DUF3348 domain-containing protein n=1 Tax=Paraburkholderia acidipaludis TaxID=660537 RepID=UPI000489AB67|nr:DUF3348 domain-containing protein [Paraburkholderia acidipaludis]
MVQAPLQAALSGPTLVRLLARLAEADVSEPQASLADRLSQWLGWTDAIALSTALSASPNAPPDPSRAGVAQALDREDAALVVTARSALTKMITRACAPANARRGARETAEAPAPADFAEFRQDYLSIQQAMETEIGQLRKRLRALLAARTPALARLAAVDAIMERSLGAREQRLLASVPALLATHFERLRRAAQQAPDEAPAASGAWLAAFRKEMQSVLLAELDIRFQPVQGLLAALRAR